MCGNLACLHIRNFRCAFVVCVKLRGFCAFGGTSGAFGGRIGLLGGGFMSFGGRLVVVGGHLLFRFSGNLVAFVVLSKLRFLHLFTYSARLVGCFLQGSIGRSGGLPTEGLRGYPLTIPILAEYQGIYIFTP